MHLTTTKPKRHRAVFHGLTISRVERLTDEAVAISFTVPPALRDEYAFEPGQHLTVRATIGGEDLRRSYSICVSRKRAQQTGELRVATARVPEGAMSNWLHDNAEPGEVLQVMTPIGGFTCPTDPGVARHHVAIAAGSGITPVMSLLSTALEEEPDSQATLVFGNRRTDTIMFLEELMDLKNRFPDRFQLFNVLSREVQDVELFSGRLDRDRLEGFFESFISVGDVDEWYLCGPLGMVETAREVLAEHDVDREHVHHEVFHVEDTKPPAPPPPPDAKPLATVTITLDGRTTQVPVKSQSESILAATLRERPDAPFSCTNGVCGTCRARVVEGEVRMDRNYALEDEEVDAGIVLTCQSHPVTDAVVIDYDA
ncbi:1,2-phenylacetyl-CoA epoxidase subunit PaaE [Ornithinimicrobium faecis]|uniref:Phenylacetate-CoA oxygenase/reductase subunit PaaK n=1 Tax=Ornithinimicrobium faecis TaxID=2934158 RepID=A0ABY4YQP8_9MICO|nr:MULTISPECIES: 1,2-phenylacetyl-CoA epoxidase subunit PaaE [unclassified Ornithinimicrobium]USQ78891.1 phenylacetate-CoA oxygenase/reductase subunit PaaK [Ornithinimicrobium sp. HY1793]